MGIPITNLGRKSKHVSQNGTKPPTHETEEFIEECACEGGSDCIVQLIETNDILPLPRSLRM